ncbi:hypothetical protein [Streptococcus gallolyticus]|uniref:hypothetical protein n=1 Tax=Streptococcus gallolyticus TaxID=315405 RepID=UPI002283E686|nr:hypothetical protein [Streptococcus gallolyticus]MCY7166384.1 hypothetical protein [Streptococcus gallolyticus subsp. gallolyticus]MCY7183778.1 hypothetical protein [Streptococcus gallolyticus subsp. gallolyticus]
MIKKYIKTTPVEAIQVTPTNHEEVKRFIGAFDIGFGEFYQMVTVSGSMWLHDYDYIIKNSDGECYPCAREVFEKTYKEVVTDD